MPEWKPEILRRLALLNLAPTREAEISDELSQHLEDRYQDLLASGQSEDAAFRTTLDELKSDLLAQGLKRIERNFYPEPIVPGNANGNPFQGIVQDVRYAVRMLMKSPGFTAIAVFTLELGIGANTAIFTIVHAVLLRPLPFKDPSKLLMLNESFKSLGFPEVGASPPDVAVIERSQKSFTSLGAFQNKGLVVSGGGEAEHITAARVSAAIFPMLGIQPLLGSTYTEQEDRPGTHVAVLGYGLWQHRYAGRSNIIGQTIELDRNPYTVIGVMPKNFQFPLPGPKYNNEPAELWIPMAFTPNELQGWGDQYNNSVLARLKPGVTFKEAHADAALVTAEIRRVYPPAIAKLFNGVTPAIVLTPLHQAVAGSVETLLLILMGAVGLVLLIACANVATLLLSRAASRSKEIAIRTALGASRGRLIRQMLTEGLVLALAGGVLGIVIAFWGTSGLLSLVPSSLALPHSAPLGGWVLAFVITVSCLTAVVFGIAPAFQVSSVHVQGSLQESGRSGTPNRARHRLQGFFVTAEFALAVILLISAGLLIRSFSKLVETSPGFRPDHLLTMSVPLSFEGYSRAAQIRQFYQQAIERIASLPGLKSVAASNDLPLESEDHEILQVEGRLSSTPGMTVTWTLGDYFSTMGIPLIEGRFFTPEDRIGSQPVAVINEEAAKLLWPGTDALGKRLGHPFPNMMRTVVGIVGDVNDGPLGSKPGPHFYLPYFQLPDDYIVYNNVIIPINLVVRTSTEPASLTSAVVAQIHSLDPQLAVTNIQTMDQEMASSVAAPKFNTFVLGLFAFLALFLAAIGIYGVLAYAVAQQSHEIGIRMALGAQRRDVMQLILIQGGRLALGGLAIGTVAALGLTRMMSSLLYSISASDPLTFAAVATVLLAVGLLACYIPARRATRVDPMIALRYE
jgi:putative ABC transport system permease protein